MIVVVEVLDVALLIKMKMLGMRANFCVCTIPDTVKSLILLETD